MEHRGSRSPLVARVVFDTTERDWFDMLSPEARMWRAGVGLGISLLPREPTLGLKRMMLPCGYWRTREFAYAWRQLSGVAPGDTLLDLGSPKEFSCHLARIRGCHVVKTDILSDEVELTRRYANGLRISGAGSGRLLAEVQDGRRLTYPDNSFDGALSLSVLEHIPDGGDSTAVQELIRVVRPGGLVIVTVPYDKSYRETWVPHAVYERDREGENLVFFERHYDGNSLHRRLVEPAGGVLADLELWGERTVRMERILSRLGVGKYIASPLEPLLSLAFLRKCSSSGGHPMAAFLTLRKSG